jgi:hypothetical protein
VRDILLAEVGGPGEEFVCRKEVDDPVGGDAGKEGGGEAEVDHFQLVGMVGIGAKRDAAAFCTGDLEELNVQVLAIGIAIDLNGFIELRGAGKHTTPISFESEAIIVNAAAWVAEDVERRIFQSRKVARCLIVSLPELGMKGAEDDVEIVETAMVHIAFARGTEVKLNGLEDPESFFIEREGFVHRGDFTSLLQDFVFVYSASDLQALSVVGDADVLIAAIESGLRHIGHSSGTVAPYRMHLEIPFELRWPIRVLLQYFASLG